MTNSIDDKSTPASEPKQTPGTPAAPAPENAEALKQAEADIAQDADLSIHSPNDDLDEGELARLGEDETGLV